MIEHTSNKRKYFGTDGIRGMANSGNMTADMALRLGISTGSMFLRGQHRNRVLIGKDTRLSCYMIETALTAGFTSVGMDVILVGPMPTPAIAMLTRSLRADLGVMISASHNPYYDNGIKLFGPDGYKLSDAVELEIEKNMDSEDFSKFLVGSKDLGRAKRLDDARGRYIEYVKNSFPKQNTLEGLKIIVDCANGAAYNIAGNIFSELGADVIELGIKPDGFNINDSCGSTHPELICKAVKEQNADLGIALDGDADRLILIDNKGNLIDGDQIIGLIASDYQKNKLLSSDKIVATSMSNLGLELYLKELNLQLIRSEVGDRYVSQEMKRSNSNLGGEQSGHIILSDYSTTGDGLIASLQVLRALVNLNCDSSSLLQVFKKVPQIIRSVSFKSADTLFAKNVINVIEDAKEKLGNNGRVLVRKSGTQDFIRIMAEGENHDLLEKIIDDIETEIEKC